MPCGCERARVGRVYFRFSDDQAWENIVSRQTPICWECTPNVPGQLPIPYRLQVRLETRTPLIITTDGQTAIPIFYESGVFFGPLRRVYGIILDRSNSGWSDGLRFDAFRNIGPPWEPILIPTVFGFGGQVFTRPGAEPGATTIRVISVRVFQSDTGQEEFSTGNGFRVWSGDRTLYSRTVATCPQVRITCDEDCPPGEERICDCCCPCPSLLSEARSIRSMLRRL